jgi:hypothetical protein
MLKVTVETDAGEPVEVELDGDAAQFKKLWEKAEVSRTKVPDPIFHAMGVAACTIKGMPNLQFDLLDRDGWLVYAVLRTMSDQLRVDYPSTFELAAHETITATIKRDLKSGRGRDATAPQLSMKITGFP